MTSATKPAVRKNIQSAGNEEAIWRVRRQKKKSPSNKTFSLIDLFAGAGGMTLGFTKSFGHSFSPVWANDFNSFAAETYNQNFGDHCLTGDIESIIQQTKKIPSANVVIGGPPCQGFSLLNKNRSNDSRKHLWRPFLDVVDKSRSSIFVMENVPQLIGSPEHELILQETKGLGFQTASTILCAADYGVPQTRNRAFILGCKFADPNEVFPPKKTHFNPSKKIRNSNEYVQDPSPWNTVKTAIADLPKPQGTEIQPAEHSPLDIHFGRKPTQKSMERYRAIPKEGMNRFDLQKRRPDLTPDCWIRKTSGGTDLFGRLWWDRPAFTIRTEFFKPEKGRYLHPQQHRPITHREAARFQSFPDSFQFTGSKTEIAKQIGNAVPPLLASRIADCVLALLLKKIK